MPGAGASHCRDDRARSISRSFDQRFARHRLDGRACHGRSGGAAYSQRRSYTASQAQARKGRAARRHRAARTEGVAAGSRGGAGFSHTWLPLPAGRTLAALIAQAAQAGITLAPPGTLRRMERESLGVRLCLGAPATEADLERALIEIRRILEMAEAISFV